MPTYQFLTLDVFTTTRFAGNPLAVFPDAAGMTDAQMQSLAAEFNLSETTFVLPPADPANTARVRIFHRTAEMAFAGHPNVGTGWALADRAADGLLRFEEIAGLVEVRLSRDGGGLSDAKVSAPQPLSLGDELPVAMVAACAGLAAADIVTAAHAPVFASVGTVFALAETTPDALARAQPDLAAFRRAAESFPHTGPIRLSLYLYVRTGEGQVRSRMFGPLSGTWEDPATGSAATPLAGLLLKLSGRQDGAWDILQGLEMGRPSLLRTTARVTPEGIMTTVGGACVPMLRGEITL